MVPSIDEGMVLERVGIVNMGDFQMVGLRGSDGGR